MPRSSSLKDIYHVIEQRFDHRRIRYPPGGTGLIGYRHLQGDMTSEVVWHF
ncbi:hypothetical protein [Aminobacterium colombiense]|nr:hypothetical protein [uncultured Aminobacterium sp.]